MRTREQVAAIQAALADPRARSMIVAALKAKEADLRACADRERLQGPEPFTSAGEICACCYEYAAEELRRAAKDVEEGRYP